MLLFYSFVQTNKNKQQLWISEQISFNFFWDLSLRNMTIFKFPQNGKIVSYNMCVSYYESRKSWFKGLKLQNTFFYRKYNYNNTLKLNNTLIEYLRYWIYNFVFNSNVYISVFLSQTRLFSDRRQTKNNQHPLLYRTTNVS